MTSSSAFPWHPCNILLPFSLASLAYPLQDSTSPEDVRALIEGIFVSDVTNNGDNGEATNCAAPTIWECKQEYEHLVKLREDINRYTRLCCSKGKTSGSIVNELYEIYSEYHASLKSCEKHNLGLEWDSGGWALPKSDQDTSTEAENTKANINMECRYILYNLGCLTVVKHIQEVRSLVEEEDWSGQIKLFSTAVAYFHHANLSVNKLQICKAMQQRAMFEAASKKSRQNHLLLSKLAMATFQSYPWQDNYFEIVAQYHDGKRLRKKKQHAEAQARILSCWNYIKGRKNSNLQLYADAELCADIRKEATIFNDNVKSDDLCTKESLPKICGKSCFQKINKSLPAKCNQAPDFFFSCLLPSELRELHSNAKSELHSWFKDWCINEIQNKTESAENFIKEGDKNISKIFSPSNIADEEFEGDEEDETQFRKNLQNEILALVEHSQLFSEETNLLGAELKREKERFQQSNQLNHSAEEQVISRLINALEWKLHCSRKNLEKTRNGNTFLLELLNKDDENNNEDSHKKGTNNLSIRGELASLLKKRQVLLSYLKKQVNNFNLIPKFRELYSNESNKVSSVPNDDRSQHRGNMWLIPYKQVVIEYKEKVMGAQSTNFCGDYDNLQNGHENFNLSWADKLRKNLKLQSQILDRMSEENSMLPSQSDSNDIKSRPTDISEDLAQGRECYQIIEKQLDQLRTEISDLSVQITKKQYHFEEQQESNAVREQQEKEDEELARTFANQQIQETKNIGSNPPTSDEEDLVEILKCIENNEKIDSSYHPQIENKCIEDTSNHYLNSFGHEIDDDLYRENIGRMNPMLKSSFRSTVSDIVPNSQNDVLGMQSDRRHSLDASFPYMHNHPTISLERSMMSPVQSVSDNSTNNIPTQNFNSSTFNTSQPQCNVNSPRGYRRPGVYQVNYYEIPQTQVNDELLATLIEFGIDAESACAALHRHDNNFEAALNDLCP